MTASRRCAMVSTPYLSFALSTASSRSITITTVVCTAVPKSAMNPTQTATEKL